MDTCTSIVFNREQTTEGNTKPNFLSQCSGKIRKNTLQCYSNGGFKRLAMDKTRRQTPKPAGEAQLQQGCFQRLHTRGNIVLLGNFMYSRHLVKLYQM